MTEIVQPLTPEEFAAQEAFDAQVEAQAQAELAQAQAVADLESKVVSNAQVQATSAKLSAAAHKKAQADLVAQAALVTMKAAEQAGPFRTYHTIDAFGNVAGGVVVTLPSGTQLTSDENGHVDITIGTTFTTQTGYSCQ
jgi:membrane protein involved in colicin uptake